MVEAQRQLQQTSKQMEAVTAVLDICSEEDIRGETWCRYATLLWFQLNYLQNDDSLSFKTLLSAPVRSKLCMLQDLDL